MTINCSSPITVNEGDDVTCLCKGEGDYPLMWYTKDGGHISGRTKEEATLTLRNINKTDNGTYTCVAESHNLAKNETSIKIIVNCKYNDLLIFVLLWKTYKRREEPSPRLKTSMFTPVSN